MSNFAEYLKNRQTSFETMAQSIKKDNTTDARQGDDRLWKPKMGQDGTGYAVIRFLPGTDSNKTPWVKVYDHAFQGATGKWYIENSLTTLGQKDPVSEYNSKLWNSGIESDKDIARKQKRRTSYMANVLVLKDPTDPSSEGKVKIYKFGQKIFDKIMGALQPEFEGDQPLNPFDIIDGANFRIKLKTVAGYWNYDSSDFERPSPLSQDESKLEAIFNAQHDIHDFVAPDKFKSYDELAKKLRDVLALDGAIQVSSGGDITPAPRQQAAPAPAAKAPTAVTTSTAVTDDDDLESYFKSLANE
jgi:hypothetical protein